MKNTVIEPHKSSLGMEANIAVAVVFIAMGVVSWLSYLGWIAWAVPLVFYYMEKESKFVKFQSAQAFVVGVMSAAISIVLRILVWATTPRDFYSALSFVMNRGWGIWTFFGTLATIFGIAFTVLYVYVVYSAYNYKQVELPIIGPLAVKAGEAIDGMIKKQ